MIDSRERLAYELEARFPNGIDVLLFDADGTLFDIKYDSWFFLTKQLAERFDLGVTAEEAEKRHGEIFDEFVLAHSQGDKDAYKNMRSQLMALWTNNGTATITRQDIEAICREIPLRDSINDVVKLAHEKGIRIGVLTASFNIVAEVMAEKMELNLANGNTDELNEKDFIAANTELLFDENGHFSGFKQSTLFELFKVIQLEQLSQEYTFTLLNLLAFGDGETDVGVFSRLHSFHKEYAKAAGSSYDDHMVITDSRIGILVDSKNPHLQELSFARVIDFKEFLVALERYIVFLEALRLRAKSRQSA